VSLPPEPAGEESLRDLLMRVVDNGKAYLRAEAAVVKATASTKAGQAAPAIGMLAGALVVLQASLTVLIAALGALLACWLGWPAGLALGALIGLAVTGVLAWLGIRTLSKVFK
jgi:hypothetical protein